jgi:hypothetical protein
MNSGKIYVYKKKIVGEKRIEDNLMPDQMRISDRLVALIDTFFGVVLGVSVTAFFGDQPLVSCPSINDLIILPNMALIVAYVAVVLSWLGYHIMIEENPFRLNRWGYFRFFIDISHIPQFTPSHNTFCTHYLIIPEWFSGDRLDV